MSQLLSSTVVAAIITGVFTLIGKWMETIQKNSAKSPTNIPLPQSTIDISPHAASLPSASVNYGTVLIHVGIVQLVANVIGVILGIVILGLNRASLGTYILVDLIFGTFAIIVCFYWFGTKVNRAIMWKHLTYVSIGAVIVTQLIDLLLGGTVSGMTVIIALIQTFFAMGIGGSIAMRRKAKVDATPSAASPYPPYQQQPPYPPYQQQPQYPPYQQQSQYPPYQQRSGDGQH